MWHQGAYIANVFRGVHPNDAPPVEGGATIAPGNARVHSATGESSDLTTMMSSAGSQGLGVGGAVGGGRDGVVVPISRVGVPGAMPIPTPLRL